jgi:hypothetical protein
MAARKTHGRPVSNIPSRISKAQGQSASILRKPEVRPQEPAAQRTTVVSRNPVAFLEGLPNPSVTHLSKASDVLYDPGLIAGATFDIFTARVPDGRVWAVTDVEYYATVPGSGLSAPFTELPSSALAGLLRFQFLADQRSEGGERTTQVFSPYNGLTTSAAERQGWSWLNEPFGPNRAGTFAQYVRGGSTILVRGTVDDPPRFPISKIGVRIRGIALTETQFQRIWRV